jgi:hypothetical protein
MRASVSQGFSFMGQLHHNRAMGSISHTSRRKKEEEEKEGQQLSLQLNRWRDSRFTISTCILCIFIRHWGVLAG